MLKKDYGNMIVGFGLSVLFKNHLTVYGIGMGES
jgi:hypothetical protein